MLATLLSPSYAVDVELTNKDGWTPLHCAASQGHLEIVQQLLARNAIVNSRAADQATPLHVACRGGHARIVRALVAAGAAVGAKDAAGQLPKQLVALAPLARQARTLAALPRSATAAGTTSASAGAAGEPSGARLSASHTTASGDGLSRAVVGQQSSFRIQVKNVKARNVDYGGARIGLRWRTTAGEPVAVEHKLVDNDDGTYDVAYTLAAPGTYSVDVSLDKRRIAGAPFTVRAAADTAAATTSSTATTTTTTAAPSTTPTTPTTTLNDANRRRIGGARIRGGAARSNAQDSDATAKPEFAVAASPTSLVLKHYCQGRIFVQMFANVAITTRS